MMTGQNIIFFANDWDSDPTSKHQVVKILARHNRVLWVNSIGLRRPSVSSHDLFRMLKKVRQFLGGPVAVHPGLYVVTPLVIPFHGLRLVRIINAWLTGRYVRAQARRLGMTRLQVWVLLPTAAMMIPYLKPEKVIYYCVDEWSAFSFLDGNLMRKMEHRLLERSDVVIVSATALYEAKRPLNPHTYLVPHGVDCEHFGRALEQTTVIPAELTALPRPIIGFWGLIHEWIDLDLLHSVATAHPEWSLILIGKISVDCTLLNRLGNVHLIGPRPYSSLPGFAKGFTAAMLPFKVNRLTESVNPIKLREYLAAGLPVVSTALPEVKPYREIVRIGSTAESFIRELEAAVTDTSETAVRQRVESVAKDTWQARVEYISRLLENPA